MHIGDILISLVGVSFAKHCPPKKKVTEAATAVTVLSQKSQTHRNLRDPSAFDKKESDCGYIHIWNYGKALIRKYYLKSDATNSKSFVSFNCSSSKVAFIEVSSLAECKALLARLQIEHMREDRQVRLICAMINSHLHSPSKILSCCFGFQKQHLCLSSNYT